MSLLVSFPILVALASAIASLAALNRPRLARELSLAGSLALLAGAVLLVLRVRDHGVQVLEVGSWPAPFGITFVADMLAALMVLITATVAVATILFARGSREPLGESAGFHPLLHFMLMGVSGAFLTGDLFNLYVWFEVLLIASFVLLTLTRTRPSLESGLKYVLINLLASTCFLAALGFLYAATGTVNLAQLAQRVPELPAHVALPIGAFLLIAFGIKAAVFPLYAWLPPAYPTPSVPVSAIFAGLLTKVGVYAMLRVTTLLFSGYPGTRTLLLGIAALTMLTGVLGAMSQGESRRILSFHIVSQIGYMVMGIGLGSPLAIAGTVFYVLHHIVVKTNLFFVAGLIQQAAGSFELYRLGGLVRKPLLAVLFLIPAMSLAGLPPLSGFWAKLLLVRAGLDLGTSLVVGVALLVGMLTLYSMLKIWNEAFWKAPPAGKALQPVSRIQIAVVAGMALVTLGIGLQPDLLFRLCTQAAQQLGDPSHYIEAVLGGDA
ncbi:MAG TPA: proton-conducting transporter membrane subunit [Candidatus Thermoplasmatota archaeon]|nr:proton-conducting transporter membrane subunit [Candidatus Thermoplasmatota archaeon]